MFIVVFKNNDILWKWKCFKVSPSKCGKSVPMPCRCIKLLSNTLSLSVPLQISSPTMSQSPPPQGREESMHNDGKGIQVSLCFIGLPPKPSKGDKKCRKNAKKPKDSFVFWIHEDDELKDMLEAAIYTIGHSHLEWMIGNWSGLLDASNFTVRYTIPWNSSYKDISIKYTIDYMTLISEVTKKPSALFNLVIEEVKVVHPTFPISNLCSSRSSPTMRTIQLIQRMKMMRMEGKRKWVLNHISHPLYASIIIENWTISWGNWTRQVDQQTQNSLCLWWLILPAALLLCISIQFPSISHTYAPEWVGFCYCEEILPNIAYII